MHKKFEEMIAMNDALNNILKGEELVMAFDVDGLRRLLFCRKNLFGFGKMDGAEMAEYLRGLYTKHLSFWVEMDCTGAARMIDFLSDLPDVIRAEMEREELEAEAKTDGRAGERKARRL